MAKKRKKTISNEITRQVKRSIARRGGIAGIIGIVLLFLIGLFNPGLRDKIVDSVPVLRKTSTQDDKPLPSNKKSPLKEGVWPVVHVVDGDTLDVRDDQGVKHRIRLVGSDTPEVVKPNHPIEPFGPEASAFTKQIIAANGSRVRVAFDGDQIDRYGRNLAMIYVPTAQGEIWLNEQLIREGLATARLQYRFSRGAKERFRLAEEEAQAARRNIWSLPR